VHSNAKCGFAGAFRTGEDGHAGGDQSLKRRGATPEKSREKRCVRVLNCLNDGSNLLGKEAKLLSENFQSNHDRGHRGQCVKLGGLRSTQRSGHDDVVHLFQITLQLSACG
jgi:hypothetical protein